MRLRTLMFSTVFAAVMVPAVALAQDAAPTEAATSESGKLRRIFADSDEAQLKRNPLFAFSRA